MDTFSKNLKRLRTAKSMTQEQAALSLGVSPQTVSRWECASTQPDISLLPAIARLYGVTIGRCFVGESMFSLVPNASKLALIYLAQTLSQTPGTLIDCQLKTEHLESMGGRYIPYDEYMKYMPSHNDEE